MFESIPLIALFIILLYVLSSIKILAEIGVPLAQAKTIVHHSEVWGDTRAQDPRLSAQLRGTRRRARCFCCRRNGPR